MSAETAFAEPGGGAVHVVATALRCAVGLSAETAGVAFRAGISGVAEHPFLVDAAGDPVLCAREPTLDPGLPLGERIAVLAALGLTEIRSKLDLAGYRPAKVRVVLALPEPRPGFGPEVVGEVERDLARRVPFPQEAIVLARVGEGHAGALQALGSAVACVTSGRCELAVIGGVDSYLHEETIEWLERQSLLSRAGIRAGLIPGEGCAFVAVVGDECLKRARLRSRGRVRSVAWALETRDPNSGGGLLGEALTDVVLAATRDLSTPEERIDDVYGDINGERPRTEDWGFALMRTAARFRDGTDYVMSAGQCGDLGAASGALGCALAIDAWRSATAHGPRALVWGGSWRGMRAAAMLQQPTE